MNPKESSDVYESTLENGENVNSVDDIVLWGVCMFLAKIKNKFMYKTDSDDYGSHWYLVYTRRNKFLYCKQVTHMYLPDSKRFYQKILDC